MFVYSKLFIKLETLQENPEPTQDGSVLETENVVFDVYPVPPVDTVMFDTTLELTVKSKLIRVEEKA